MKTVSSLRPRARIAVLTALFSFAVSYPSLSADGAESSPARSDTLSADPAPPPTSVRAADREIERWTARTLEKPADVSAWVELGDAWMQRSREAMDPADYARAEGAYRRALSLDPNRVSAMVGLAWVANTRHDFEEGRRWAREALRRAEDTPRAHALLGDAAMEVGDYDEAMEHFQAALDARPDLSSYARSAHLLWLTGDARRAVALMHRAIRAGGPDPENAAWCRAELGMMYLHQGAVLAARQQLEKAVAAAPKHPHVLAAMGRFHLTRKDYPQAIEWYEKALAVAPQHGTLAALVDLYEWTGRRTDAERCTRRLLEFHDVHSHGPESGADHAHGHASSELARFLADRDRDLDLALEQAETAYRTFRGVYAADALAWCYHKKGRHAEAVRTIRKALRWNTPDASLLFHAGTIFEAAGDRAAARTMFSRALSLNPDFHPVDAELAARKLRQADAVASDRVETPSATPGASPASATGARL